MNHTKKTNKTVLTTNSWKQHLASQTECFLYPQNDKLLLEAKISIYQVYFICYPLLLIIFTYLMLKKKAMELQRECSLIEIDYAP